MAMHQTQVLQAAMVLQAVRNTSSSIELLREAVSNSIDADARNIEIKLTNYSGDIWNILIQDDGHGMTDKHMAAFFNTADSVKDFQVPGGGNLSIGEKGLGSKTSFVARRIDIESRYYLTPQDLLVAKMVDPMAALLSGDMPTYETEINPVSFSPSLITQGTRILLSEVRISTFNGKQTLDPHEIGARVVHYLRTMTAAGTVKNRHAAKPHVAASVMNVGVIPMITVEVVTGQNNVNVGPVPGVFDIPPSNVNPQGGSVTLGIPENSKNFCDIYDFSGVKTLSVAGQNTVVHYDGTAVIAGGTVRSQMLKDELRQGLTHKSQMGVHLCKDFIPLRNDAAYSRDLLSAEYYYEFKVFLNCQNFELNADRNVITNLDSDEISWIWEDFRKNIWTQLEARSLPYKTMNENERTAIEAVRKSQDAEALKTSYSTVPNVVVNRSDIDLKFVKVPRKEADASHLLAMMVQSGEWAHELEPLARFGQYIDSSTDALVENIDGDPQLVEIEMSLPNLFKHRHPMASYDVVVVWDLGNMTNGTVKDVPWGANGQKVQVTLIQGGSHRWHLKWGTHTRPVIVLKEILEQFDQKTSSQMK